MAKIIKIIYSLEVDESITQDQARNNTELSCFFNYKFIDKEIIISC